MSLLGHSLELVKSEGLSWHLSQLLFEDDMTLLADIENLFKLVSELGRVRERRKL